jgi:hypothetical protein
MKFAPRLAKFFYAKHRRHFFSDGLDDEIQRELEKILKLARPQNPHTFRRESISAVDRQLLATSSSAPAFCRCAVEAGRDAKRLGSASAPTEKTGVGERQVSHPYVMIELLRSNLI